MIRLTGILLVSLLFLSSCATRKEGRKTETGKLKKLKIEQLHQEILANQLSPKWFSAKIKMKYEDDESSRSFTVNLRYRTDSLLWASVAGPLGIEVARVLVSADSVFIIDRMGKKYYHQPISYIEYYLPFPVSLKTMQAMALGQRLYWDYEEEELKNTDGSYVLTAQSKRISSMEHFDPSFNMVTAQLKDHQLYRELKIELDEIRAEEDSGHDFSYSRDIRFSGESPASLEMEFTRVEWDIPKRMPFSVSDKYESVP